LLFESPPSHVVFAESIANMKTKTFHNPSIVHLWSKQYNYIYFFYYIEIIDANNSTFWGGGAKRGSGRWDGARVMF